MKKLLAILMALTLTSSLAACGSKSSDSDSSGGSSVSGSDGKSESSVKDPAELLTTVWSSYGDDEKFPVVGGTIGVEEDMVTDAPGKFSVADGAVMDTHLAFPEASADRVDDAASFIHMMNANTFTCGAFHIKDSGDVAGVSAAIKDNVMGRHWMCGFPEKLIIVTVDDYIVSAFGSGDLIDTFRDKLTAAYDSAEIFCDEPIEL